jgi:hypothetical protein
MLKQPIVRGKLQFCHAVGKAVDVHRDPVDFLVQVGCLLRRYIAAGHSERPYIIAGRTKRSNGPAGCGQIGQDHGRKPLA